MQFFVFPSLQLNLLKPGNFRAALVFEMVGILDLNYFRLVEQATTHLAALSTLPQFCTALRRSVCGRDAYVAKVLFHFLLLEVIIHVQQFHVASYLASRGIPAQE